MSMLADRAWAPLSSELAEEFTGKAPPVEAKGRNPYLLRAVMNPAGYNKLVNVDVFRDGVRVAYVCYRASDDRGLRNVPMVVWLKQAPKDVFVTVGYLE